MSQEKPTESETRASTPVDAGNSRGQPVDYLGWNHIDDSHTSWDRFIEDDNTLIASLESKDTVAQLQFDTTSVPANIQDEVIQGASSLSTGILLAEDWTRFDMVHRDQKSVAQVYFNRRLDDSLAVGFAIENKYMQGYIIGKVNSIQQELRDLKADIGNIKRDTQAILAILQGGKTAGQLPQQASSSAFSKKTNVPKSPLSRSVSPPPAQPAGKDPDHLRLLDQIKALGVEISDTVHRMEEIQVEAKGIVKQLDDMERAGSYTEMVPLQSRKAELRDELTARKQVYQDLCKSRSELEQKAGISASSSSVWTTPMAVSERKVLPGPSKPTGATVMSFSGGQVTFSSTMPSGSSFM